MSATLSPCGQYRYRLWRAWDESKPRVLFVMLNPSTADAEADDPTIKKCVKFARAWGYGSLEVVNLFALRSTDPAAFKGHPNPVGAGNDSYILDAASRAGKIVAAWGSNKAIGDRGTQVRAMLAREGFDLYCLRVSDKGMPWHPLYIPDAQTPVEFSLSQQAGA